MPAFKALDGDIEADICIVGAGLAGVWCSYLLSKEGKKIVLIDCDKVGRAATLYTTAFVTEVIDTPLEELSKMFDEKSAREVWQSGAEAIDRIERVIEEEGIDCEFMRLPLHMYARSEEELRSFEREADLARALGFKGRLVHKPLDGFENCGAFRIEDQAKYHPMKFFKGLLEATVSNGVEVYEDTEAVEILASNPTTVRTASGHSIVAQDVVVTTYEPFNNPEPTHFKKGMYVSYVYELELPEGSVPEGLYIDSANPYHYVRVDNLGNKQRMIVGGEDHRALIKFEDEKSFKALKGYIDKTFPNLSYKVLNKWQGAILEPSDGLPLIGQVAEHEYVACAFSGNGMTYSATAGALITDLILGRVNDYSSLYDPRRSLKPGAVLRKARDYTQEFFGGAIKNLFK
ncbi:FAD-binding oxidoreductase [Candidatus Parcubacteria bacterium]|nr:FAD-binding oxidoreductase [Candidatus Parcubacteria bacterium]